MDYSIQDHGDTREIKFVGNFTFSDNPAVLNLINSLGDDGYESCVLTLSGLESIDSAGLGMLILLNDAAQEKAVALRIRSPQGQVKKMLEITEFNDIIPIDE